MVAGARYRRQVEAGEAVLASYEDRHEATRRGWPKAESTYRDARETLDQNESKMQAIQEADG